MDPIALIKGVQDELRRLQFDDNGTLDALRRKTRLYIGKIFGNMSQYLTEEENISFHTYVSPLPRSEEIRAWESGKQEYNNLLNTMLEDINLSAQDRTQGDGKAKREISNRVFVVHGHDEEMKQSVARTIERLGLEPVILHEQADRGRTIIQKFIEESETTSFAVVLLSPDDKAFAIKDPETVRHRARQNVIFELGYFLGKLEPSHVLALYRNADDFELPSDYQGVLFTAYDNSESWKLKMVKELKACGYNVDANRIL